MHLKLRQMLNKTALLRLRGLHVSVTRVRAARSTCFNAVIAYSKIWQGQGQHKQLSHSNVMLMILTGLRSYWFLNWPLRFRLSKESKSSEHNHSITFLSMILKPTRQVYTLYYKILYAIKSKSNFHFNGIQLLIALITFFISLSVCCLICVLEILKAGIWFNLWSHYWGFSAAMRLRMILQIPPKNN